MYFANALAWHDEALCELIEVGQNLEEGLAQGFDLAHSDTTVQDAVDAVVNTGDRVIPLMEASLPWERATHGS